jgi:Tfp pilus assembly protein PilP
MKLIVLFLLTVFLSCSVLAKVSVKNALELRDPFKRPMLKSKSNKKSASKYYKGGIYTNQQTIQGTPLNKIKIVGVMLGKNRRALAKIEGNTNIFIVQEGQVLGLDGAVVKGILPAGIVLVEKIKNVYDDFEYLETLIPIESE